MAGEKEWMPSDLPDFVKEAEKSLANGESFDAPPPEEVTIKFGKGLVGDPFISKNGKELVEVKIPNVDPEDRTPWASFVKMCIRDRVLGGILGIIFLVGIHYVTKGNYKFSAQSGENSISLQPVNLKDEVSASTQIEESVEEEND